MAFLTKTTNIPIFLTYEKHSMYLHIDFNGCALFRENCNEAFFRLQEPLLLAHGIMTDPQTVHLVFLKTSGELCYTVITGYSPPQTMLIANLDVRTTRYRRLFLFPQGKTIHIFYAYSNQAIPDLWHIEHRYWDGSSWRSVHLGEVVNSREPLYHVNLDSQKNVHLLTITFQGRHSILFANRFNGTFHLWGSPTETLKMSGEVVDMTAFMTSDNIHHLYWVAKTLTGQYEVREAQQCEAQELASVWHPSPTPIKTFNSPWKSIGAIEINGHLWLLAHTEEEVLMRNNGKGWIQTSSHLTLNRPIQWVHNDKRHTNKTYWLEDQIEMRTLAYHLELGLTIKKQVNSSTEALSSPPVQAALPTPPPVPAFYPEHSPINSPLTLNSETIQPLVLPALERETSSISIEPVTSNVASAHVDSRNASAADVLEGTENPELEALMKTVAHLEQANSRLNLTIETMLSKFDQLLESTTENAILSKTTETGSSLDDIDDQKEICQLQEDTEYHKEKGGFWSKWFSSI